jgi:hypothetical protein
MITLAAKKKTVSNPDGPSGPALMSETELLPY